MGRRGRLRRGYSLEVIFEEDPDFNSHLDSLDSLSVAFRFGVKEGGEDTISVDSLVEEYQIRFQNRNKKEQVFRSLDGVWDVREMESSFVEWDEFSPDSSMSKMAPGAEGLGTKHGRLDGAILDGGTDAAPNGRRSRVSRRQIVEASWIFDSSDDSSGNDNDSTCTEIEKEPEPEIEPLLIANINTSASTQVSKEHLIREIDESPLSGGPPLTSFPHGPIDDDRGFRDDRPDTLDSYISTRTDDTETNAYNFADPFDDAQSVASTNFDSSTSTSSDGSVCTVNGRPSDESTVPSVSSSNSTSPILQTNSNNKFRTKLSIGLQSPMTLGQKYLGSTVPGSTVQTDPHPPSNQPDSLSICTDLKKVRALFEIPSNNNSRKSSFGDENNNKPTSPKNSSSNSSPRLFAKNPVSPTSSSGSGGVPKKLKAAGQLNDQEIVSKVLRSAYTHFNNQGTGGEGGSGGKVKGHLIDFADLLVNDNVVIEDNPDLYQTLRRRHKEAGSHQSAGSTLRRSKSMGSGISSAGIKTSRMSILAEEMPPPDTVKNVRTVFEQMLKMRSGKSDGAKSLHIPPHSSSSSNLHNSFSIIKKSLSSVKSNPTSKIYRSESMRDDFPTSGGGSSSLMILAHPSPRFGKPVLMTSSGSSSGSPEPQIQSQGSHVANLRRHLTVERKYSEPIKFSPKVINPQPETVGDENEEEFLSITSSINDSDNPPKFVSPDVLQRIRSWGTSTTYFGGEIVARTEKNRKLAPPRRRHTVMDFVDFHPSDYKAGSPGGSSSGTSPTKFYDCDDNVSWDGGSKGRGDERMLDMDLMFGGIRGLAGCVDTTPRIISVVPKSPSNSGSPSKSSSPVGSIIEGRNSPEGCESQDSKSIWLNEIPVSEELVRDGNNNNVEIDSKIDPSTQLPNNNIDKKFSQVTEGAWF